MPMRAYITRPILPAGMAVLDGRVALDIEPGPDAPPPDRVIERIAQADGVLSLVPTVIDAEVIAAAPRLRVISNFAVGVDNIDVTAASAAGIVVTNTPDVLTETTADLAFALLMATARRLTEAERVVRAGEWKLWQPDMLLGTDVYGATLGLVGMGRIGRAVARRARGFDMRVLYANRRRDEASEAALGVEHRSLDDLLAESDFVSIHAPLTSETRGLFGAEQFRRMKKTAMLINTARGPIVDQAALAAALKSGEIAAAGLDVTDPEPIRMDDALLSLPNCVILPHIGSASQRTRNLMAETAAKNLLAALEGRRPPNPVNPEVIDEGRWRGMDKR